MMGSQKFQEYPMVWSQTQKYQIQQYNFPNQKIQSEQISPFQNVNIAQRKTIPVNQPYENSLKSSAIHSEFNTKNNLQHFLYEETKPRQYREKPFEKIQQCRSDQLQIFVPSKSNLRQLSYAQNYDYSCMTNRSHVEGEQAQGEKKKKISVVSKSLISQTKIC